MQYTDTSPCGFHESPCKFQLHIKPQSGKAHIRYVLCHFARCLLKQWWQAARARQGAALRPIITLSLNAPYNVPSKASTAAVARLHAPHKRDINIQKEPGIIFTLLPAHSKPEIIIKECSTFR
jgi:hypothetical protein